MLDDDEANHPIAPAPASVHVAPATDGWDIAVLPQAAPASSGWNLKLKL
ncbi:unnamed protein product [Arabidopsis thaliana]|nr:unnamed protein product [Arabidopsis thaliana]